MSPERPSQLWRRGLRVHASGLSDRSKLLSLPLTLFPKMPPQGGDRDIQAIRGEHLLNVLIGEVLLLADLRDLVAHGPQQLSEGEAAVSFWSGDQPLLQLLLLRLKVHAHKIL